MGCRWRYQPRLEVRIEPYRGPLSGCVRREEWHHRTVSQDRLRTYRVRGVAFSLAWLTVACFNNDPRDIVGEFGSSTPMAEGVQQSDVGFEIFDPTAHRFWVEVTMPLGTELLIDFVDPDGGVVRIFDQRMITVCVEAGDNLVCSLPPLNLRGHPPGPWNATIRKSSGPAAVVELTTMVERLRP